MPLLQLVVVRLHDITDDCPAVNIRPFRNADLPALVRIWVEHWSMAGPPPYVNQAKFEQAVLSRTFFDPRTMLVAESSDGDGGEVLGWSHFSLPDADSDTALVHALCLGSAVETAIGLQLVSAIENVCGHGTPIRVGVVRDDQRGYAGLEPIGFGIGIPLADYRTTNILQQAGFTPLPAVLRMLATVSGYRPPVSREALQYRRSAKVEFHPELSSDPRVAAGLSHVDVERVTLTDAAGQLLATVRVWFSDPEAEVMSPTAAILDLKAQHEAGRLQPAESYLIGSLVQSLARRNVQTVETAVDREQETLVGQLQKLQFPSVDEGMCWQKTAT
ncbi:MAG: hypothetical protein ACR2NZ_08030 [Rubripirellula sp.]